MSNFDTTLKQLHRLDPPRLRAVARRLEASQLQSLVIESARRSNAEDLDLVREIIAFREEPGTSAPEPAPPVEVASSPNATLLSWQMLESLPGGEAITAGADAFFDITAPLQAFLQGTAIDAFGVEIEGVEAFLEDHLAVREFDWDLVVNHQLKQDRLHLEFETAGLGLTWFSRGPHVRRRPYLYLIGGGGVETGAGDAPETSISPFVARYNGPDDEVTADSWTDWFAEAAFGPKQLRVGDTDLSLSFFRSAGGPGSVVRQLVSDVASIAGDLSAPPERKGWEGWAVQVRADDGPQSRTFQLGSSFYS